MRHSITCINNKQFHFSMIWKRAHIFRTCFISIEQESIPVGCVSSACQPYVFWWPFLGGGEGTSSHASWDRSHDMEYPPPVDRMTDRHLWKHYLPVKLLLWVVIILSACDIMNRMSKFKAMNWGIFQSTSFLKRSQFPLCVNILK